MNRYAEHRAVVDGQGMAAVADWNYVLPCPLISSAFGKKDTRVVIMKQTIVIALILSVALIISAYLIAIHQRYGLVTATNSNTNNMAT